MTKSILSLFASLALLGAASCNSTPSDLSEVKDPTTADSLMYYLGELQAEEYWRRASVDTTFDTPEELEIYLQGVADGIKFSKSDDAYNRGLKRGISLAIQTTELEQSYGINLDRQLLVAGIRHSLKDDTAVNLTDVRTLFYKMIDNLNLGKIDRETEQGRKALASHAGYMAMRLVSPDLYGKDVTPATSTPLNIGDRVSLEITAATVKGKMAGGHFPKATLIKTGRRADIIDEALLTMADGQTRQFLTTPMALFGRQYVRMGFNPSEPIIVTIRAQRINPDSQTSDEIN